ncbi:Dimethyladenosine transferase 1, mitochondrial [Linnemannia zychae]|nr:Dimethyladenosine transferase 1, mitochondrial [Linnemannia zychae]
MLRSQPLFRSLPRLLSPDLWPTTYKLSRARGQVRVSVMTEDAASPGQLTRSMYLAGAKKIVTVENNDLFQSSLQKLEEESGGVIKNFNSNPLADPFEEILGPKNNAIPDLEVQEWNDIQSNMMLVGTIPNSSNGEKCLYDLIIASISRMGIFHYGRVEMFMFVFKDAAKRILAAPGTPARGRVAVLAETAAKVTSIMRPGVAHFHLPLLGPGADILLGRLSFDHNIKVKHMTMEQFDEVAQKFNQWPLRPQVLYDDLILHESKRKRT